MQYAIPKGVFDILPDAEEEWRISDHWHYVEEVMRKCAHDYNYKEIRTPLFERTELFVRSVGEGSDIVTKEMYTFLDKAERSMTLRPEGTASVMRSFIENQLNQKGSIHKLFYIGPMFRYERPQSGRYRQHHQFGAEAIGNSAPEQDVEMIDLLCELYRRLGLQKLTVMLNSIGDESTREHYRDALGNYLRPFLDQLSEESQARFSKNILRILDSKDPQDQKLLENAPSILDFLSDESKEHFECVCKLLEKLKIRIQINPRLVRGLDYYNKTVFEVTSGDLGAQNALGGGGRYDALMHSLGGPALPAIGFATGIERILQTMIKQNVAFPHPPHPILFFVPIGEKARSYCLELLVQLRHQRIAADMDLSCKKVQHGLQLADSAHAEYCVVMGDQELQTHSVKLKHMQTRKEEEVPLNSLIDCIKSKIQVTS